MSNKMLGPGGTIWKHTLQDDMESLIYVVMYCALLYLPHNLSDQELAQKIWLLFEDAELMEGRLVGGLGKLDNMASQIHTKSVEFNTSLKEWLNSMMKFCRPRHVPKGTEDPWTEVQLLDKFWADFLERHTLETNDRRPHEHPHVTDRYEIHGEASRVSSEAISLGKRTSEEGSLDHPRSSKKPCLLAAESTPTRPVRRSKRLLAQQEHFQPRRVSRSTARAPARTKVTTRGRSARRK